VLFFFRLIFNVLGSSIYLFQSLFIFVSCGSILVGALGALNQTRVKRFLAYASINQVGFILIGVSSCNFMGLFISLIYLLLYVVTSLGFFTIFLNVQHIRSRRGIIYLCDLQSLSYYDSEISKHLTIIILSMSSLPPLGGFFGKFFIYIVTIKSSLDALNCYSLLVSIISAFYYISMLRYLYFESPTVMPVYIAKVKFQSYWLLRVLSFFLIFYYVILSNL
jgi:NADH-quinone oxidoreductase subunit N